MGRTVKALNSRLCRNPDRVATSANARLKAAIANCQHYAEPRYRLGVLMMNFIGDTERAMSLFQECVDQAAGATIAQRCQEYLIDPTNPYGY